LKIAIIHDWLVVYAGAEKVLEQMINCFPDADIFSTVDHLDDEKRGFLKGKRATTTFVQNLPMSKSKYRAYLPLMPLAIEQLDLSSYDVIVSSSYAVAKGVITGPDQVHLSYVHSPIRYAWDLQHQYLRESGLDKKKSGWIARAILHYMRNWDVRTANGVDYFLCNSDFIRRRIWKVYRREADVLYPPVDVDAFSLQTDKEPFYLTASRMVPYKKMDLIVAAFSAMPQRKLKVIGDGPDLEKIRAQAGPNVEVMGYQPFSELKRQMGSAQAFVFAAEEDFGITPVEAQASGTPVIAFGKGGALETVVDLDAPAPRLPTGVFFDEQSVESIVAAVERFETNRERFDPNVCRDNALRFSNDAFRTQFTAAVEEAWAARRAAATALRQGVPVVLQRSAVQGHGAPEGSAMMRAATSTPDAPEIDAASTRASVSKEASLIAGQEPNHGGGGGRSATSHPSDALV